MTLETWVILTVLEAAVHVLATMVSLTVITVSEGAVRGAPVELVLALDPDLRVHVEVAINVLPVR